MKAHGSVRDNVTIAYFGQGMLVSYTVLCNYAPPPPHPPTHSPPTPFSVKKKKKKKVVRVVGGGRTLAA